jgi:hypothetical protein
MIAREANRSRTTLSSSIVMDPHDVNSGGQRSSSFPTSCSLRSLSLSDDCGELSSGRTFPSTGTIPILLYDDDDDDADDLLGRDPASLTTARLGVANNAKSEGADCSAGHDGAQDSSSGDLRGLGIGVSSAIRGCSREKSGGGGQRNRLSGSRRLGHLASNPADLEPSTGSAGDRKDDSRRDASLYLDMDSPPSSRSRCCSSSSGSSSLSCLSQANRFHAPGGQNTRRTRHGSCGASPAAITNTQVIAPTEKHTQGSPLEIFDPQIGQPSSNSIPLYDCVDHPQLPLTLNRDHYYDDHRSQQREAHTASSSASSSAEADLSIEFPPRDRKMGFGLPPPYSPLEPSSPPSSSNSNLPRYLAWLHNTTISLCIDQEGFRAVLPTFKLVGYTKPTLPIHSSRAGMQKLLAGNGNGGEGGTSIKKLSELMEQASTDSNSAANLNVGMAEFMPLKRESFVFHHAAFDTPPSIRRLSVNGDESRDYLSKHAYLSIKSSGGFQVYAVCGSEIRRGCGGEDTGARSDGGTSSSGPIKLEWRFEYTVEDKRKGDGTKAGGGEKFLTPLRFSCSPGLLHSRQGRKVTVLNVWKKSIQPKLVAGKVEFPIIRSPTTSGHQTHNLAGPASPPMSPKGVGIGSLRFPTTSKLWGKRAKSSPYRFDKGSDGSEEDLIPSEDSGSRRRRPRPTSAYVSRVSQEAERLLQKWDGERGKSTDALGSAWWDGRPSTAGAERSRGRSKTENIGRGATSENECERLSSRSQGAQSAPRFRRPRTAR